MAENVDTISCEIASQRGITDSKPKLGRIGSVDVKSALLLGLDDFQASRAYVIFLGIVYVLLSLVLIRPIATVWCSSSSH